MLDGERADCKAYSMSSPPTTIFPDPRFANRHGLLAAGRNLEPDTLLTAYRSGIFPWYEQGGPILWWSPDPRMVLFPSEFHCSRRLARRMRQGGLCLTRNKDFAGVMHACAEREEGTWIHPEMIEAYSRLFELGHAASIEVWRGEGLVGGLYGVKLGRVFFAESMFSRVSDASKMALAQLCSQDWQMIDCQFHTDHLQSLGAVEIPRSDFLTRLAAGIGETTREA